MLTKQGLRSQITLLCTGLILLTVVLLLTTYWIRTSAFTQVHINRQMDNAQNVLEEFLLARERLLITSARVLTADFGFKQAVASQDKDTIASVLLNHGERINADLMVLTNLKGQLLSLSPQTLLGQPNVIDRIGRLPLRNDRSQFLYVDNVFYQVIVLPVQAPRLIAYTMIGFKIDQEAIQELKNLTSVDISLLDETNTIRLASLNNDSLTEDIDFSGSISADTRLVSGSDEPKVSAGLIRFFERPDYQHKLILLDNFKGFRVVLSSSLIEEYAEFDQLFQSIIFIGAGIMLIAVLFSQLLVRGITNPLQRLVKLTRLIAQGEFNIAPSTAPAAREFQELNKAFTLMGEEIDQREQEIKYQAERDTLTGLYNRYYLVSYLDAVDSTTQPHCLLSVNLREFKKINDVMGPDIGDSVLWVFANRIKQVLSKQLLDVSGCFASRIGSDEFILVVPGIPSKEVSSFIAKLRQILAEPCVIDDLTVSVSCYISYLETGAQSHIADHQAARNWLRKLAIANSAAKKEQVDVRAYQEGEDEAYLYRLSLIEQLKQELVDNTGELFLHYQPKLNLTTNEIDKLEALIRWIKRDEGFISPEMFIDLAEQSGLIIELTQWVITQVLEQMSKWSKMGHYFKVSVNISAQDVIHEEFIHYLLEQLAIYKVSPEQITLEITERDLMENEALAIDTLNKLKAIGISVSVDDYGIGQSSLSKLKQLPVDELKIDKSFIMTLNECSKDQDIVGSTISLGHKLGLKVVAEGVENSESLELLRAMQCDHIQGYYLSRPVSPHDLLEWVNTYAVPC